ncbi:hypothetical protein DsansV1_C12g0114291 [Dioscorea sansibarensis]
MNLHGLEHQVPCTCVSELGSIMTLVQFRIFLCREAVMSLTPC